MHDKPSRWILDEAALTGWITIRRSDWNGTITPVAVRCHVGSPQEVQFIVRELGLAPSRERRAAVEAAFAAGEILAGLRILIEE